MLHFCKLSLLPLAVILLLPTSSRAARIQTLDLTTLCFLSTDVVEARLTRHHLPGQDEWKDTFTATVLNPLEGSHHAGDIIKRLDLTLYDPSRTGQRCLLFLTSKPDALYGLRRNPPLVRLVDMLIVDHQSRVHRYFQWDDPGGLVAQGFRLVPIAPPSNVKITRVHGNLEYFYQEHDGYVEDDSAEQRFRTVSDERVLIASRWTAAKKMKTPPYQVLKDTER